MRFLVHSIWRKIKAEALDSIAYVYYVTIGFWLGWFVHSNFIG